MSNTTGYTNSCDITTIYPMGVVCVTENASSASASDGSMSVFVTGGTAPYTIQWSNGMSGVFTLNNLPPGTYFATVTDYYGDYVETAACVVGGIPASPTPTPSITPSNMATSTPTPTYSNTPTLTQTQTLTPTLTQTQTLTPTPTVTVSVSNTPGVSQTPTPTYSQTPTQTYTQTPTITPTQTYTQTTTPTQTYTQTTTPTQTYTQTPTPSPTSPAIPQTMCLELDQPPYTTLEFGYDGNYNGYPQWTATTDPSIVMSFNLNPNFRRWEISNYPSVGNTSIVNTSPLFIPLGSWSELGTSNTWILTSGDCPVRRLNVSYVVTDETCLRSADGTVTVTMNGGTAPFTLQLNNLTPVTTSSTSYTFTGLNSGPNTLVVSDSGGQSSIQNFTVGSGSNSTTYQITFTSSVTTNGPQTQNSRNETLSWTLGVTPPLPAGASLTFNLNVIRQKYQQTSTNVAPSQVATYGGSNTLSTTNVTINSNVTYGPTPYTSPGSVCGVFSGESSTETTNMTISSTSSVSGVVNYSVSVPSPIQWQCPVFGSTTIYVQVDSLSISGVPCAGVASENQILNHQLIVGTAQS